MLQLHELSSSTFQNSKLYFHATCVRCHCLDIHHHIISTQRLHLGLVFLTWHQPIHCVVGKVGCSLERPLMVHAEI